MKMHMECKCGEYLTNVSCPNEIVLWAYPDSQWKEIQTIGTIDPVLIPDSVFEIWNCPKCKRLHVFRYPENRCSEYEIVSAAPLQRVADKKRELWHVFTDAEWDEIIFPNEIDTSKIPSSSIKIKIDDDYTRLFLLDSKKKRTIEYRFVPDPEELTPRILNHSKTE